jgi:CRISPR/Cas system CSM-associated protein Csm3 (group 7 of RAMP superfamily)
MIMTTKYFKCTLITDVVLNASLATEGNLKSLDFIPGSNFLGIAARTIYKKIDANEAFDIFHSNEVSFGDALISKNIKISYSMPFSLFQDKLNNDVIKNSIWVHHGILGQTVNEDGAKLQLKQQRSGYLNTENKFINNVDKNFSLKSAYDKNQRRSAEGKMFGFEALKKGQEFIFAVDFINNKHIALVTNALEGKKRLGKSKTAQYGQVKIDEIDKLSIFESKPCKNNQLVIYADSRLCFLNEYSNPTFQPKPSDFGINKTDFNWKASQIRTYSYSPWNTKRNTYDGQRDSIERGSVLVIDLAENENINIENLPKQVGEYQSEGFGRIIYNPEFLNFDVDGKWIFEWKNEPEENSETKPEPTKVPISSILGKFLMKKNENDEIELKIGKEILNVFSSENGKILLDDKITKSQWGGIRSKATLAKNIDDLDAELFKPETGFLMHGVAYEKIWSKHKDKRINALKTIIKENKELGIKFVAKLAAEIAKKNQ